MLLRKSSDVIAISQPSHAWLAGDLARAWRLDAVPAPRETVIRAATLHDIGWLDWEARPTLDPRTGLPLEFQNVPVAIHTRLWTQGVTHAARYGAMEALLVSRHGDAIYEKTFDRATATPEAAAIVRDFLLVQADFQTRMIAALRTVPELVQAVADAALDAAKRFIVAVDTLSLNLCWGIDEEVVIRDVPYVPGKFGDVTLRRSGTGDVTLDPWPFAADRVVATIEGRHLSGPVADQPALDRAIADAPIVRVATTLRPA